MNQLIGRKCEQRELKGLLEDSRPQLVGVYGRRRVGKTFLIRNVCNQEGYTFIEITGQKGRPLTQQLNNFSESLGRSLGLSAPLKIPSSWREAFELLTTLISKIPGKKIVFIDELPWLATKRSGLLEELDYYWNTKWNKIESFKMILCGSAASWMIEKLINAKGGLHNRLTKTIALKSFSLTETEKFLIEKKINLDRAQLLDLYFCTGGIPFYLSLLPSKSSAAQLIQSLAFEENGRLLTEYDTLLESLFDNSNSHRTIIKILASKRYGLTRIELKKLSNFSRGDALTKPLKELEASGFIRKLVPFGGSQRSAYYQLVDEYTLFYHKWIDPVRSGVGVLPQGYWLHEFGSQRYSAWAGLTLEIVCLKHINELLRALSVSGMKVMPSTWRSLPNTSKLKLNQSNAQIDIVLDRADRVINLCEIKYRRDPMSITAELENNLLRKQSSFIEQTKTKRSVKNILFSSGGYRSKEEEKIPSLAVDGILDINALFA